MYIHFWRKWRTHTHRTNLKWKIQWINPQVLCIYTLISTLSSSIKTTQQPEDECSWQIICYRIFRHFYYLWPMHFRWTSTFWPLIMTQSIFWYVSNVLGLFLLSLFFFSLSLCVHRNNEIYSTLIVRWYSVCFRFGKMIASFVRFPPFF